MMIDMDSNDIINHKAAQNKYLCFFFLYEYEKNRLKCYAIINKKPVQKDN